MSSQPQHHVAFDFVRSRAIDTLSVELQEFRHRATGAPHLHLAAQDKQNAFLVAFRTVPEDSRGVAHILEHTALCGSQLYPVRDPFFMMTRRSLNTFMNAFTSSDWTAYPFASCNRKDFVNLMQVYLDAAFFPTLDELDFLQEGHRLEFAEPENPNSELVYKGVVFNEMKGAMSSPVSALWQELTRQLFPTVTYHHNSGGDPEAIPDLTWQQLKDFHARHYHPSNAVFMTYGDISAAEHQELFQDRALHAFQQDSSHIRVGAEQRYTAPLAVEAEYALDGSDAEATERKTHIVLGWLLGRNTNMRDVLSAQLVAGVLLDNSASPLRHALETTELGSAPSPLCGFQDSTFEMVFAAGVEGSDPEQAEQVEQLILDTLRRVAEEGLPLETVESNLHQIELSQREVSGDGFPYGLQLMLQALTPAVHDADPAAALDIDDSLNWLREQIQEPNFIRRLVREMLLDNPHRVRLTMRPDPELSARRLAREAARLAAIRDGLSESEREEILRKTRELEKRQQQADDPTCLPRVTREDIPAELEIPESISRPLARLPLTLFDRGTNGLVYEQLVVELPKLDLEHTNLLPLFSDLLTEVGCGEFDYLTIQRRQAAVTGGLAARLAVRTAVEDRSRHHGYFVLTGKALVRNQGALSELIAQTFEAPRFDEIARLRELVAQERLDMEQSVTSRGHSFAMVAAAASISPVTLLDQHWGGLSALQRLIELDKALSEEEAQQQLSQRLAQIARELQAGNKQGLLIAEGEHLDEFHQRLQQAWGRIGGAGTTLPMGLMAPTGKIRQAWLTSTQVNFCAKAWGCVPQAHPDAAALVVLASFLRNNFLHRAIREQGGAYGGGASYDRDAGAFRFYSYRDPRLAETLADFDRSIDWLISNQHEERLLEEAILGIIADIDKPGSPAGEARKAFHNALNGRTPTQRREFRQRILDVSLSDLRRVAETWLKGEADGVAVITNSRNMTGSGLELETIALS